MKIFSHLANVGDTRSLVIHPASTTHVRMTDEALALAGIGAGTIRLSIGLEDPADLIDDLNKECFQIAVRVGEEQDTREWAMTMLLVARALERIGDNAVDIGEQVAFVVTGLFREFEDASHPGQAPLPSS